MSPVDLVVILVIANAVQNAMTGGDNSLIGGVIAATMLVAVNIASRESAIESRASNTSSRARRHRA
jgi:uncharacterized membrane protein YcaP (DUF421 family)